MALDIGPETIDLFVDEISRARTIIWNGPMGVFEMPAFAHGTMQVPRPWRTILQRSQSSAVAILWLQFTRPGSPINITHISTGGGASLEFLEGKKLPGVEALTEKTA